MLFLLLGCFSAASRIWYSVSLTGAGTILLEFGSYTMWGSVRPPVEDVTDALLDRGGEAGIFGGGGLLSDGWIWAVLGEAGGDWGRNAVGYE